MYVLGFHFGHDASMCLIRDGSIQEYYLRERHSRNKHCISLFYEDIKAFLHAAGVEFKDIDYCAVTSTQNMEFIFDNNAINIEHKFDQPIDLPCTLTNNIKLKPPLISTLMDQLYNDSQEFAAVAYRKLFPEAAEKDKAFWHSTPFIDNYVSAPVWQNANTLNQLNLRLSELKNEQLRYGFHSPIEMTLDGVTKSGFCVNHHMCHAAASFYTSDFKKAAILTHDGFGNGVGYQSGMFYIGVDNAIYPIWPHHLDIGAIYARVAVRLGLGDVGAPGKMMGLSAYGKPIFYDSRCMGNYYDRSVDKCFTDFWIEQCLEKATFMGIDTAPFGDKDKVLEQINVDIAASTQKLFEESRLQAVNVLHNIMQFSGECVSNLCLSGGTALNCPSNSQILNESPFESVYIEPLCDDGGLSIGAAFFVHYNLLNNERHATNNHNTLSPYMGTQVEAESDLEKIAEKYELELHDSEDFVADIAHALQNNKVVAYFEGKSEAGPRALGHRSILANPCYKDNWQRVNKIKQREQWRPFAPVTLQEKFGDYFADTDARCPYMLFNARVISQDIPAVTHVDGTARVQTVTSEMNGNYYRIVNAFGELSSVYVLMNTSLNGPGEPIVETMEQAVRLFANTELDLLCINGQLVKKPNRHIENIMSDIAQNLEKA
ncbi:MAG: carbamoyltransferase C-terminal domain-containing protein [Pseudomonadota bacterium]